MPPKFMLPRPPASSAKPFEQRLNQIVAWTVTALMLGSLLVLVWQILSSGNLVERNGWSCSLFLIIAALGTVLTQAHHSSGLKVILAAIIIGLGGGATHWVGTTTNLPFGPIVFTEDSGPKIVEKISWAMPWLWIIVVLNTRGVSRLILRPWRKTKTYGFWVIGLTTGLVTLLAVAFDPFATHTGHYWLWLPTRFPFTWYNMPWSNALGWALTTLLLLAFVTPLLISRGSRTRKLPPNYQSLLIWGLLLSLGAIGAVAGKLWAALVFDVLVLTISTYFAIRGARW